MAVLQKTRLLPNMRLDLPDYRRIESFICGDVQAIKKHIFTDENFVVQGFEATGTGTSELAVALAGSTAILGENGGQLYIGAASLTTLKTSTLTPGTTNFVEIFINFDTGGADSRVFWDKTANNGAGGEFSQIVDTFTFVNANFAVNTSSFTGEVVNLPICEVDVNGSGVITEIRDARNMFFRLGRRGNVTFDFPWISRVEPATTDFTGADKDLKTFKDMLDALMTSIKEIQGTTYWYETASVSLIDAFRNVGLSKLISETISARMSWDGTDLSITDDNGTPNDSDILARLRLFDTTVDINLTRQDGANTIAVADGEVVWIEIPDPLTNVSYDSVGFTASNYRVNTRGSVPNNDTTYWLAYREGTRLFLRDLGELEAGESKQVSDETTTALRTFLGFDPEIATSVPYAAFPNTALLPADFTTASSLVTAISANTENINFLADVLTNNAYDELMDVVTGAPANDNEITGPVTINTIITLPFDSRDSDSVESYIVGKGLLEVYLNGQYQLLDTDWEEVGTAGLPSTQIKILRQLEIDDKLIFRIDTAGGFSVGGAAGNSLQAAYNIGSSIVVSTGNPITVSGPASEKLFRVLGDMEVTGVIDPAGLEFTRQGSDPLGATADGLWVDASGDLMQKRNGLPDVNITAAAAGGVPEEQEVPLENNSGNPINAFIPVGIDINGDIEPVDVSTEASAITVVGVVKSTIGDGSAGQIVSSGLLKNITGFNFGEVLWVSKTGTLTSTKPSIGVGGFIAGDFIIKIGVVTKNQSNPLNKDLMIQVQLMGQL